ncbi:hypothetical protein, partial [Amycolatopsis palatopharyngis]|uniref:hypothetical protein n=1 Tax=Amycolatopsis palatopharyngis TaxID=187982 RepID=UPI001B860A39
VCRWIASWVELERHPLAYPVDVGMSNVSRPPVIDFAPRDRGRPGRITAGQKSYGEDVCRILAGRSPKWALRPARDGAAAVHQ